MGGNNESSTPLHWFTCLSRLAHHSKGNSISISQLQHACCGAGFHKNFRRYNVLGLLIHIHFIYMYI